MSFKYIGLERCYRSFAGHEPQQRLLAVFGHEDAQRYHRVDAQDLHNNKDMELPNGTTVSMKRFLNQIGVSHEDIREAVQASVVVAFDYVAGKRDVWDMLPEAPEIMNPEQWERIYGVRPGERALIPVEL